MANPIITENLNAGSTGWNFIPNWATGGEIAAYCDKCAYNPGDTVNFFCSTKVAGTTYSVNIYRIGWYQGNGGCLKSTSTGRTGVAQGYFDGTTLNNCPTAIINNTTHNIEAGWSITDTWTIPGNAVTGIYTAIFTDQNGLQHACYFTVKGNAAADYVVVRPDTTDAAYNNWGGWSLYTNQTVGVQVNLNRPKVIPNTSSGTAMGLYAFEIPSIKWLEQQGYNLSYISDIDLHVNGYSALSPYKAYISLGHDEYWTLEMRNAVESARASGRGIAFLGANDCYWQCRLSADAAGNPNRTITCYKVKTVNNNLNLDPYYGVDNSRVTTAWSDVFLNKPENALTGLQWSSTTQAGNNPWTVDSNAYSTALGARLLAGTGLVASQSYGTDLVGYEYDQTPPNPVTQSPNYVSSPPGNLIILGTTPLTNNASQSDYSNTSVYIGSGGGLVFCSGSIAWTWGLDSFRRHSVAPIVPQIQVLMGNIMGALKGSVFGPFAMHQ